MRVRERESVSVHCTGNDIWQAHMACYPAMCACTQSWHAHGMTGWPQAQDGQCSWNHVLAKCLFFNDKFGAVVQSQDGRISCSHHMYKKPHSWQTEWPCRQANCSVGNITMKRCSFSGATTSFSKVLMTIQWQEGDWVVVLIGDGCKVVIQGIHIDDG